MCVVWDAIDLMSAKILDAKAYCEDLSEQRSWIYRESMNHRNVLSNNHDISECPQWFMMCVISTIFLAIIFIQKMIRDLLLTPIHIVYIDTIWKVFYYHKSMVIKALGRFPDFLFHSICLLLNGIANIFLVWRRTGRKILKEAWLNIRPLF